MQFYGCFGPNRNHIQSANEICVAESKKTGTKNKVYFNIAFFMLLGTVCPLFAFDLYNSICLYVC
jgi:hypothetical protein